MSAALSLLFVLDQLTVKLVGEGIDGGVHVQLGGFGMQVRTSGMQCTGCLLTFFLDGKGDMHIGDVVIVSLNATELLVYVVA